MLNNAPICLNLITIICHSSIYLVHDELKDKQFELELSWVSKDTNGRHQLVPRELASEAENLAKQALADIEDSDEGDM